MAHGITNGISLYRKINQLRPVDVIPLDIFFENIRNGTWQDIVLPVRTIEDKKERDAVKEKAPYVTVSGVFKERTDNGIMQHSGYISIDIDNVPDPNEAKSLLCVDPYVVAAFVSISGRGLCLIFKINPEKHREAFQGISEYLFRRYGVISDPTSINVSRARFVSYDPYLYVNEQAQRFTEYPKSKPPKRVDKVVFTSDDFEQVLKQIVERRLNLTEDYHDWLRMGFALAHKFGEAGRQYFHIISQYSSKYDTAKTDKQYDVLLKRNGAGGKQETTISTFYYYAKQAGLDVYSPRTRTITASAAQGKKAGLSAATVADNLAKFEGIEDALPVVEQVMQDGIEADGETGEIEQLEMFVRQNYSLERNEVTRYIENNGIPLKQAELNSIYIRARKLIPKVSYELVDRLINSDFVPTYNPFLRYFAERKDGEYGEGHIKKLFSTVSTIDSDYLYYFGTKWLVSIIAAIHGTHSPLMLVLSGEEQNTGKTQWFRRLLPAALKQYYAESKLDAGKDDEILMTQKLLIMDDEMGGKSKQESRRLKELTSKDTFSLREPYGRNNVDLKRLAVLCGTTNDNEIINDPTGNRRIVPAHVYSIDKAAYNSINKDALFMEAYALYVNGFNWELDKADIEYLKQHTGTFQVSVAESELILKYFTPGEGVQMTASEVKVYIEAKTNQRLSMERIGKELKRLGFMQRHVRAGSTTRRVYYLDEVHGAGNAIAGRRDEDPKEDLPF